MKAQATLLHISPFAVRAGCEMDCYRLIRALPDMRHEVLVLDSPGEMSGEWLKLGARVTHLGCLSQSTSRFIAALKAAVAGREFTSIMLWSMTRFAYILHALRGLDLPVGIHIGNPVQRRFLRSLNYVLAERLYAPLPGARLLACSEHVRRSLAVEPILAAMPSEVIYNPIDVPAEPHVPRALDAGSAVRVGMVARLDPIKDHATLLRAWPQVLKSFPHAVLELVGDGELREGLLRLAHELGVAGSVRFLGHQSDVTSITRNWDIFVYSTTGQEGLGNAAAEALALGLPAVVCDLPVMREVCGEEAAVDYYPAGDETALAARVVRLIPDLAHRRQIGRLARLRASVVFDPTDCARKHLAALGLSRSEQTEGGNSAPVRRLLLHISPLAMQAGCEMNCLRIMQSLPGWEHRVLVLDREGPMTKIWREAGATVEHLAILSESRMTFYAKLQRHLRDLQARPDGIIYWSISRLSLVLNAARSTKAPLVAHVGNPATYSVLQSAWARIDELVLPALPGARLATCSEHVRASLPNSSYLRRFAADVIHNPVELPVLRHEVRPLRREEPIRLGMVARIDPIKDHATVLHALRLLREYYPQISLEFAGDGELRAAMEQLTSQLGLKDCVRFLGHVQDVNRLIVEWDAFLYSTTAQEGLGNALIEAQAVGLPCVVSDLPMMREVGGDDGGCAYFRAGDADALARVVGALLENIDQCRNLAGKGRARVAGKFSPSLAAGLYIKALGLAQ